MLPDQPTIDDPRPPTPPPAPPRRSSLGPPPPPPRATTAHPRPWRERLPEAAATIGAVLVAVASAGFVTSSWERLADPTQAVLLGAGAIAMTVLATWFESLERRGLQPVIGLAMLAAVTMTVAAATLGLAALVPGTGRLAILVGGGAGLVHAVALLGERRDQVSLVVAAWASAAFAAGPPGRSWSDRWSADVAELLGRPVAGFFDPSLTSDVHLVTGLAHLAVGVALVGCLHLLGTRARVTARVLAIATLAHAALQLNILENPLGAVAALGIVIGHVLVGLRREDVTLVVAGAIGTFAAGLRVLAAVFTGKVLATIAVLVGGLVLLGWSIRAMRERDRAAAGPGEI